MIHTPVLFEEVMTYLDLQPGQTVIDATLGATGHAREIAKRVGKSGQVLGIERDADLAHRAKKEKISQLIVSEGNYTEMKTFVKQHKLKKIDRVLFDFGLSSWHLEGSGRGFSFLRDEVLDMRFSIKDTKGAAELVNTLSEKQLADIFMSYGEERHARAIARAIVEARREKRILTTMELSTIIGRVVHASGKINPATRVFQALRIAVNNELDAVAQGLQAAMDLVTPGGRVVAISFHSLEDKIIKDAFRSRGHALTKKPVVASRTEIQKNSRARSAKLRAWENVV